MQSKTKKKYNNKTKKGGINLSGCPEGKVRAFGSHCGIFRTPLGCCIDSREEKIKKMTSFSNNIFGGKKSKKNNKKSKKTRQQLKKTIKKTQLKKNN